MNRTLYLKKKNSKGEEVLFPSSEQPAFITEYTYSAARMGGIPTITGTVKHPLCLDDLWTREEYVEFEGVKFYVTQVPTSSKSNDDIRYKHEITFRSERDLLDNIYFFDVVTPQTESQYADRFRSNATKFSFYGDIKEFVSRLNDSLVYSGIGDKFNIILDEGVESDTKEISFSDKFFSEALQEIFNIYELPYYWVGNTCHVGECQAEKSFLEDEYLSYGQDKGLLSVSKTNGNYRLIDRVTGIGSSNNIPYYYPNSSAVGTAIYEVANMSAADVRNVDLNKILAYNANLYQDTYTLRNSPEWFPYTVIWSQNYDVKPFVKETGLPDPQGRVTWEDGYILVGAYVYASRKTEIITKDTSWKISKPSYIELSIDKTETVVVDLNVDGKIEFREDRISVVPTMQQIIDEGWYFVGVRCTLRVDQYDEYDPEVGQLSLVSIVPQGSFDVKYKGGYGYFFTYGNGNQIAVAASGIELTGVENLPCEYSKFTLQETIDENGAGHYKIVETIDEDKSSTTPATIRITGRRWIAPQQNLMPPIYLESDGAERFYNAINDEYEHPDGGYYVFPNEYVEGKQREGIVSFDDIMPTIKGVVNANNVPFAEIADIAFDENDSDIQDDEGNYIHSYFYIRLNIFNGQFGFNLFAQALESGAATINMTSGNCAPCAFEIAVEKELLDGKYVFYNPVVTDGQGNLKKVSDVKSGASYMGDYIATKENRDNWTDEQQNTYLNSVWVAVKKETNTFGIVMPNSSNKHRPTKGDTFVITNILMPDVLIRAAENRLKEQLIEYLAKNNVERFDFSNKLSRVFIHSNPGIASKINENSKINVVYNDKAYPLYVTNYTCRADGNILDEISVEFATELSPSQNSIQKQISAIKGDIIKATNKTKPSSVDLASLDKRYLSKLSDDTAKGEITFEKGAKFGQNHSINEQGNATLNDVTASKYKGKNGVVNLDGDTDISGDANVSGSIDITKNAIIGGNAQIGGDAEIGGLAKAKSVEIGKYVGGEFGSGAKVYVDDNNSSHLIVDFATIRKKATFNEITVKDLKHVGGAIILSAASGVIERVENVGGNYKCYFKTSDADSKTIKNEFVINDLVRCQVFNFTDGNRYYWRKVIEKGTNYIVLSATDADTNSDVPLAGDNISLFGNTTDKDRQAAFIISAYGDNTPSITYYQGVNSFDLTNKIIRQDGYDKKTQRAYTTTYGDSYVGARDESTYMRFTPEDGVEIKGKLHIESGSTGAEQLVDFGDTMVNNAQRLLQGKYNLLRNSGFTGDFVTEILSEGSVQNPDSEMFSPPLDHWVIGSGSVVVNDSAISESGKEAHLASGTLSQTLNDKLIKGETYIFSLKAHGNMNLAVRCYNSITNIASSYTFTITEDWQKHIFKFVADDDYTHISLYSVDCTICELQLERGNVPSAWGRSFLDNQSNYAYYQSLRYLASAMADGSTDILGGLILTTMINLGNYKDGKLVKSTAGTSGIYNEDDDVAFWAGGSLEQAIALVSKIRNGETPTTEEWANLAKYVVTHGGDAILKGTIFADSGYFRGRLEAREGYFNGKVDIANEKILLNEDGSGHLANGNVKWNEEGDTEVQGTIKADNFYHGMRYVQGGEQYEYIRTIATEDVIIINAVGWTANGDPQSDATEYAFDDKVYYSNNIILPHPSDVVGKLITIYNKASENASMKPYLVAAYKEEVNNDNMFGSAEEYYSLAGKHKAVVIAEQVNNDYYWVVLE